MARCDHQYVVTDRIVTCLNCPLSVEVLYPDEVAAEARAAELARKRVKPGDKSAAPKKARGFA